MTAFTTVERRPARVQALARGTLGVALLHLERGDRQAAKPLLAHAVSAGVSIGANASLFHGSPALEFVLSRHAPADHRLTAAVDRVVADRLAGAAKRRHAGRLVSLAEFDLIQGLAGLGALLLTRPNARLLPDVLAALVALAHPVGDSALPGWWADGGPGHVPMSGGHSNNGMAHGIAAPLALLALAARRGIVMDGQDEAIETFASWLERYGGYWTTRDQFGSQPLSVPLARPSWCYGEIGIARALQLAGLALGNPARARAAEDRAAATLGDDRALRLVVDASLCHGWAGLLAATRAIAADQPAPGRFAQHLAALAERTAAGVGDLPGPGFLEGSAGALVALAGDTTGWTRALLIT